MSPSSHIRIQNIDSISGLYRVSAKNRNGRRRRRGNPPNNQPAGRRRILEEYVHQRRCNRKCYDCCSSTWRRGNGCGGRSVKTCSLFWSCHASPYHHFSTAGRQRRRRPPPLRSNQVHDYVDESSEDHCGWWLGWRRVSTINGSIAGIVMLYTPQQRVHLVRVALA